MKKTMKYILAAIAVLAVGLLVALNRKTAAVNDELAAAGQLEIVTPAGSQVYGFTEGGDDYVSFDTEMRRKNGDVFEKNYTGRELVTILNALDITVTENTAVTVTCADQYEIELSGAELLDAGNVFIVNRENGEALDEESGPFMLVVNHDEFATRWGKNIVKVTVRE